MYFVGYLHIVDLINALNIVRI